jgi:hypothetical protein
VCNMGYSPMQGPATSPLPLKCSACSAGKFKSRPSRAPADASDSYIESEKCQECEVGQYAVHRDEPIA